MDWVHCNVCGFQPGQLPKRNYKLTSCGHVFCNLCVHAVSTEKCKMCNVQCTTTPLSADMAAEVQLYFEDPEVALNKIIRVMEFQKSHRVRLNEYFRNMRDKYANLKVAYQQLDEEVKTLKRKLEAYKNKEGIQFVTPPQPKPGYPLFSRNSQASQAIRGMSQPVPASPANSLFTTPSPNGARSGYRNQNNTPSTPMSNMSSPASLSSRQSYRSGQSQRSYQELPHPITNSLNMLSVNSQRARNSPHYQNHRVYNI